jgi:hypothetical protein
MKKRKVLINSKTINGLLVWMIDKTVFYKDFIKFSRQRGFRYTVQLAEKKEGK